MSTHQDEKVYYYILHVITGKEEQVCTKIKNCLCNQSFTPFTFKKNVSFKRGKEISEVTRIIFPGYIFIKSCLAETAFLIKIMNFVRKTSDILKLLNCGSYEEISVNETEINFLLELCNDNYCIEYSKGLIEGDRVKVIEGPIKGHESRILKINKQKKYAVIEVDMMGDIRRTTIGFEYIMKAD